MSGALLLLGLSSLTFMGCIIPRAPDYEVPPNTPAIVRGREPTPQTQLLLIDLDQARANEVSEFRLFAEIEDPDVDQPLEAVVFLNFPPAAEGGERPLPITGLTLPPEDDGTPTLRSAEFTIPLAALPQMPDCHTLDVTVNEEYIGVAPPLPPDPLQEGRGTWFLGVGDELGPPTVDLCPDAPLLGGM